MAEIIRMPRLSDTMEEGNIVAWLKKEGDPVKTGDILAEVETDKATMELESYFNGVLLYIGVPSGPVAVDGIIAIIGKEGEEYKHLLSENKRLFLPRSFLKVLKLRKLLMKLLHLLSLQKLKKWKHLLKLFLIN
jgi:pyruvate/2-oxoglutarate dehydrogenase complex dihydrolipoamide acyltransferase (E2) component